LRPAQLSALPLTPRLAPLLTLLLTLLCATLSLPANAAATNDPTGTWRLMKDQDGRIPKPGSVVEITFSGGRITFKATQPDETVTDTGTYTVQGRRITVEFKDLEQGRQSGSFSRSADTLVLPFQMLGGGAGWSIWMTPAALESFLAKVPAKPSTPETMPALLARVQKVAEAFGNERERQAMAQRAKANAARYRGGEAEAWYAQGVIFFTKGYYREAWYGFARAAVLQPTNAVYLHNLATTLQEIGSQSDARRILEWVTANYPNLDPPWGSLAVGCLALKDTACARAALQRAQALAPENGLYDYAMGRTLDQEGRKEPALAAYRKAYSKGYSGSGKEGAR
jgi:cytochrome c-type biogenesis protein CcmH/NrfG